MDQPETPLERHRRLAREHYHRNREARLVRMREYGREQRAKIPKTVRLTCKQCGVEYECPKIASRRRLYCSPKCLEISKKDTRDAWRAEHREELREKKKQYDSQHKEAARYRREENYAKMRETDPDGPYKYWREKNLDARSRTPWNRLLSPARGRARENGLPFDLTIQWAKDRWTGKCEVSGLPFDLTSIGHGPKPFSPSIDRINPKLGYVQTNCRIVIFAVNAAKNCGTDQDMLQVAKAIVQGLTK